MKQYSIIPCDNKDRHLFCHFQKVMKNQFFGEQLAFIILLVQQISLLICILRFYGITEKNIDFIRFSCIIIHKQVYIYLKIYITIECTYKDINHLLQISPDSSAGNTHLHKRQYHSRPCISPACGPRYPWETLSSRWELNK